MNAGYKNRFIYTAFVILIASAISVTAAGCGQKNQSVEMPEVGEEVNASNYTYSDGAKVTLKMGEKDADISLYTLSTGDGKYAFRSGILTDVFGFEQSGKWNGFVRFDDKDGNRLLVEPGSNTILLNGEAVGLSADIYDAGSGEFVLPDDFFFVLPGITGVSLRRDGADLLIHLETK